MALRKFLISLTIALVIILAVAIWFFPARDDFRTENPFWNGSRELAARYPISPLESLTDLPSSPQGSTLILIPYLPFLPGELEALNNFVTNGGTLILADDYGHGNQVLEYLGLRVRFSGQPLLDPLVNYQHQWLPRITHFTTSVITNNLQSLVLNHATSLAEIENNQVIAWSSSISFLDQNGDETWQEDEPTGPLPVISLHKLGPGQVILMADPSLFINSMGEMESNDTLMKNITTMTTARLFFDQSHLLPSNLHQTKNLLADLRGTLLTSAGTLGLVILTLALTLMPLWRERR